MNNMEIEIRAKINDLKFLEKKLSQLENIYETKSQERQVDTYFKHENDKDRKLIIRIRKNYKNKNTAILTFKSKAPKKQDDIAWQDFDTEIINPDKLENLLLDSGYDYYCLIDKVRQSFEYKKFEINIDNIRDLGQFIEVEKNGNEKEIVKIKSEILDLLKLLGINENNVINKGYVQLVINKINK